MKALNKSTLVLIKEAYFGVHFPDSAKHSLSCIRRNVVTNDNIKETDMFSKNLHSTQNITLKHIYKQG